MARFVRVIFHNLSGYDSHIFINDLVQSTELKGPVSVIPENEERYISFTKNVENKNDKKWRKKNPKNQISFRFFDSFRFMPCCLKKFISFVFETKNYC